MTAAMVEPPFDLPCDRFDSVRKGWALVVGAGHDSLASHRLNESCGVLPLNFREICHVELIK
jgi:hypothetical protein